MIDGSRGRVPAAARAGLPAKHHRTSAFQKSTRRGNVDGPHAATTLLRMEETVPERERLLEQACRNDSDLQAGSDSDLEAFKTFSALTDAAWGTKDEEGLPTVGHEMFVQAKLSVPLSVGLIANFCLCVISLGFVGHLGTTELAAAALATTLYEMTAKLLLTGMLGALDTYASQAVGAHTHGLLGVIFRQATLFLALHTIPIAIAFAFMPRLLAYLGQPEEVMRLLGPYLLALIPAVWIDAVYRPFNRILTAQHISLPQMWISCTVAVQHVGATYAFIHPLRFGYVGAAYATVWSSLLATVLLAAYVRASGLYLRVWSVPPGVRIRFQSWWPYMKLSYAAAAMRTIESWSLCLCGVAAGWLPDPAPALAATAVAFSIYGIIHEVEWSLLIAACTRVGNGLGAGSAAIAKRAAFAAAVAVPLAWLAIALVLTIPMSQRLVIGLFTASTDTALLSHMRHLLWLLAAMLFFDIWQSVMSGVAAGAGKQAAGFLINTIAHWGFALPAALLLGFRLHLDVEGLYMGIILGPFVQFIFFTVLVWRLDWDTEAWEAHAYILQVAESMRGDGI